MVEAIARLKEAYPAFRSEIDGIEGSLESLTNLEEVIFEKTQGKVYESTQPMLGVLARMYQYTMSFVFNCGTQNYNGANADVRCVAETNCAAYWLLEKPDRMLSANTGNVSVGKVLHCGYSRDQRLKEIYFQSSGIVHFRPESFRLNPVISSKGQRQWSALGLGWSPHYAQQAFSSMSILHSIFSDISQKLTGTEEIYFRRGSVMADEAKTNPSFSCRGYEPRETAVNISEEKGAP